MRHSKPGIQYDILAVGILALAVAAFFYPVFRGEVLFFGDNLSLKLPNAIYAATRLRQGELPFWNPYLFAGIPFLADISTQVFYPLSWLFLVIDPFWALTGAVMLSVFLAGLFCFLLAKSWGLSREASLFSAITFMLGAAVVHYTTYLPLLSSSIWLPLTVLAYQRAVASESRRWIAFGGVSLALQILGGHPQPVFYTLLLLFGYGVCFAFGKSFLRRLAVLAVMGGIALGLSGVVVLPAIQLMRLSTRSALDYVSATADSLNPWLVLRLLLPNLFDNPKLGMTWGPAWRHVADNTGYAGILCLFFVLLAGRRILQKKRGQKRRLFLFFLGTALVSLLLALGRYTPVYRVFYASIPFFRFFRGPGEALFPFSFSAALLGGIAFEELIKRGLALTRARRVFLLTAVVWLLGVGMFAVSQFGFHLVWRPVSAFHSFERDQLIVRSVAANLVWASFVVGAGVIFLSGKRPGLLIALAFFDLVFFNSRYLFTAPREVFRLESAADSQLKAIENKFTFQDRLLSYQDYQPFTGLGNYWENMTLRPPFAETYYNFEEQRTHRLLNQRLTNLALDWNMVNKLPSPNGYASFVLADYARFIGGNRISAWGLNEVGLGEVEPEKLNVLSVAYFLTEQGMVGNNQALPRARVLDHSGEPVGEAEILVNEPERLVISAEAQRQGTLVLADSFYPGWTAYLDGSKVGIGKFQETFRSVKIPGGDHLVELIFRPRLVCVGALISGFTFVIVLTLSLGKEANGERRV